MKGIRVTSTNSWMIAMLSDEFKVTRNAWPLRWWQHKIRHYVTIPTPDGWSGRHGTKVQLSVYRSAQSASYFVAEFNMELLEDIS